MKIKRTSRSKVKVKVLSMSESSAVEDVISDIADESGWIR